MFLRCILRTDANWDGIAFCCSFDTEAGTWQTLRLPFSDFKPVFRAKTLTDGTRLDPEGISSVQLMLSKCAPLSLVPVYIMCRNLTELSSAVPSFLCRRKQAARSGLVWSFALSSFAFSPRVLARGQASRC